MYAKRASIPPGTPGTTILVYGKTPGPSALDPPMKAVLFLALFSLYPNTWVKSLKFADDITLIGLSSDVQVGDGPSAGGVRINIGSMLWSQAVMNFKTFKSLFRLHC